MSNTEEPKPEWIDPAELFDRGVYRIRSRNLPYGVYRAATRGFIGIREKMGSVYLFEEYEWDASTTYGTARALDYMGQLPDEIEMRETNPTECETCGQPCVYDDDLKEKWMAEGLNPGQFPYSPWECQGEPCENPQPFRRGYVPLFDYLMGVDPEMTRCTVCQEIAFYCTPWDSDKGSWKHTGTFRWTQEDEADHEVVPTDSA